MPRETESSRFQGQVQQGKLFYCATLNGANQVVATVARKSVYAFSFISIYNANVGAVTAKLNIKDPAGNRVYIMQVSVPGSNGSAQLVDHGQLLYLGPGYILEVSSTGVVDVVVSGQIYWLPS